MQIGDRFHVLILLFYTGVSTRNVMDVVESLGVDNISVSYGEMFFRIIRRK